MAWHDFEIDKELIGEVKGSGSMYESRFITLPENEVYESGYGFFMGVKLVSSWNGTISIPDGYKMELQMSPELREPGKRYKRYKLTGQEIKETVFFPYQKKQAELEKKKAQERDRRNRKVMGRIVYGYYRGNTYLGRPDYAPDYFFFNGSRYYNRTHEKVQNVKEEFTVMKGVSKYFFDIKIEEIEKRLRGFLCVRGCLESLKQIKDPDERTQNMISFMESEYEQFLEDLRRDLTDN